MNEDWIDSFVQAQHTHSDRAETVADWIVVALAIGAAVAMLAGWI